MWSDDSDLGGSDGDGAEADTGDEMGSLVTASEDEDSDDALTPHGMGPVHCPLPLQIAPPSVLGYLWRASDSPHLPSAAGSAPNPHVVFSSSSSSELAVRKPCPSSTAAPHS